MEGVDIIKKIFVFMRSTLFILLIALIFILLTLIPRTVEYKLDRYTVKEINQIFTWKEYRERVSSYLKFIVENRSLGVNTNGSPIEEELFRLANRSLKLIIPSFILSLVLGVIKGVFDFRSRNRKRSVLGNGATWLFQAIPDFFLIIGFQYLVLILIRKGFPRIPLYGFTEWYHLILPIFFLTLFTMVYVARITSSLLIEQEREEYIRTAISKGISQTQIIYKHMLKNCLGKLFDFLPMIMLNLLTHLIIVEHLMYYQGIAVRFFDAFVLKTVFSVGTQFPINYPFIIGTILFITVILLVTEWIRIFGKFLVIPYSKGESK